MVSHQLQVQCRDQCSTTELHHYGSTFTVYAITLKILEHSAHFFVGILGTVGQHEFAFGFCVSVGGEISRVRKSGLRRGIRALPALLLPSCYRRAAGSARIYCTAAGASKFTGIKSGRLQREGNIRPILIIWHFHPSKSTKGSNYTYKGKVGCKYSV